MTWYFAYGSNLWMDQMVARTGSLYLGTTPRIARLPGCRLAFNMRGKDGQVYANIRSPGEYVLGVIYLCVPGVIEKLDAFEEGYHRERITVVDGANESVEAFVYRANLESEFDGGTPCGEYVQRIVRGARQHGLPETYICEIELLARTTD